MKKLLVIISIVILLCFTFGCQDKEAMAELEEFKVQAEVEEQNKELVKLTIEAFEKGEFEALKELLAPDFAYYYPSGNPTPMSQEVTIGIGKMLQIAFPDRKWSIEEMIAAGDRVIFRYIQRSTHKGDYMGIPATGNKLEISGIMIAHVKNGKVVEVREESDMLSMMTQLGMEFKPKEEKK